MEFHRPLKRASRGVTLTELVISAAIMGILGMGFTSLVKYTLRATTSGRVQGEAQEITRQGLMKLERSLRHANQITLASSTLVEFTLDFEHNPSYDASADPDGDGVPNFRDGDRDGDVQLLLAATAQWRAGYNLKDDDEDGDQKIDARKRIYLASGNLYEDTSINEQAWGSRISILMTEVSTFTLSYFGNKANTLGANIDLGNDGTSGTGDSGENDGVITVREMDWVQAAAGMGNRSGSVDTSNERRYITTVRLYVGVDRNKDSRLDYMVETDVYPPLVALKAR